MSGNKNLNIAIIGAGPAGCLLARLLYLEGIPTTVFEGEATPNIRTQGGTLDLHAESGMVAMKEANLFAEFQAKARYEGQYLAMVDQNARRLFVRGEGGSGNMGERPEIDRSSLRDVLIESLPEGMVKWGHRLDRVDAESKTLHFQDGTSTSGFDLIVGADGAWSKVRNAVDPTLQPVYTGVGLHEMSIPDAENTAPELHKAVNNGSIFASSPGHRVCIQQMGDGSLHMYTSFLRKDPDWANPDKCGYDPYNLEEVKEAMKDEYPGWCPLLKDAFTVQAQGKTVPRSLHILPVGQTWAHKPGFTLIGDAAHLMTPYSGEGVNQALEDAMFLGRALIEAARQGKDLDEQVQKFEKEIVPRAQNIQQMSLDVMEDWMFTNDGAGTIIPRVMSRHVNCSLPKWLHGFGRFCTYIFYYFQLWTRAD